MDVGIGLPEMIYTSEGHKYLHLPCIILTENTTGGMRYLLSDGLGSIRHVVDEAGEVVRYQEFDPYGNPVGENEMSYGYTGEWWEAEVGLLHLRARWYMPETGTFLSKDPWEGDELRPATMNGWSYVEGNPINRIDPTGLCGADRDMQLTQQCVNLAKILEAEYGLTVYWPNRKDLVLDPCDKYPSTPLPVSQREYKQWTRDELTGVAIGVIMYKDEIGKKPIRMVLDGVVFARLKGNVPSEYFSEWTHYAAGFEGKPVIGFSDDIHDGLYNDFWYVTWTSVHEIAHRIHHFMQKNNLKDIDNDYETNISGDGPTYYSQIGSSREDIAESITVYLWERHSSGWVDTNGFGVQVNILWDPLILWSWADNLDKGRTQLVEDIFDVLKKAAN